MFTNWPGSGFFVGFRCLCGRSPVFHAVFDDVTGAFQRNPFLRHTVTVANGNGLVFQGVKVYGETEGVPASSRRR